MLGRDLLIYLSIKYKGNFEKIYSAIKTKEVVNEEEAKKILSKCKNKTLTILDREYPESLKQVTMPPLVLYYKGDISLLKENKPHLAVVGSRECSDYGTNITKEIVNGIKSDTVIVSGGARGIDTVAHQTCLARGGRTIAVLGSGLEKAYPNSNKELFDKIAKEGLLISEYPDDVDPQPDNFPMRNRIVAGVSNKVLVTEAERNSGTNITVLFALRTGKDVMAVPHEAGKQSACNRLIQDGAFLVENAEDVNFLMRDHKEKDLHIESKQNTTQNEVE